MQRIATLSRFIARATGRALPFFKILRKTLHFEGNAESKQAFQELKSYLG